jgi:hypothetical protein
VVKVRGEKKMFDRIAQVIQWVSIPMLLLAAPFAFVMERYEPLLGLAICVGAIFFLQRAVRLAEYFLGAGFMAITIAFSPLPPMTRVFLLMGFTFVAAFLSIVTAFRTRAVAAL